MNHKDSQKNLKSSEINPPRLMTDFEVHTFLKEMKGAQQRNTPTPLATITYETLRYLDGAPCAKQSKDQVQRAIAALSSISPSLPMSTVVQIVNNPPKTVLDVQVIMGEKIYKMSDEDVEKIVILCKEIFQD